MEGVDFVVYGMLSLVRRPICGPWERGHKTQNGVTPLDLAAFVLTAQNAFFEFEFAVANLQAANFLVAAVSFRPSVDVTAAQPAHVLPLQVGVAHSIPYGFFGLQHKLACSTQKSLHGGAAFLKRHD